MLKIGCPCIEGSQDGSGLAAGGDVPTGTASRCFDPIMIGIALFFLCLLVVTVGIMHEDVLAEFLRCEGRVARATSTVPSALQQMHCDGYAN